jgi:2-polyprenyl-3-methyl-5-hydroxy-6-metoxy-1,4-benzoquinol methylase
MKPDLSKRSYEEELIDDLNLSNDDLKQNLIELERINRWLGGNKVTISGLKKLLAQDTFGAHFIPRIADLGCGGGDMLKLMADYARANNKRINFVGIDANEFMINYAKRNTADYPNITYRQENIFSEAFQNISYDAFIMTLFCHHIEEDELIDFLAHCKMNCNYGVVINDIHRHWFAYHSIAWLTKLFSKSYLVKNDAKLSVWRAFTRVELEHILKKAGFKYYTIKWKWAFRWEVIAYKKKPDFWQEVPPVFKPFRVKIVE